MASIVDIVTSQTIEGAALPYRIFAVIDYKDHKQFRKLMAQKYDYQDISIRMDKYLSSVYINFRNEVDAASFLLLSGE